MGDILLYCRDNIPTKQIPSQMFGDIESIAIEINIYKKKWLVYGTYNPNKSLITNHLSILRKSIDHYSPFYDNVILL